LRGHLDPDLDAVGTDEVLALARSLARAPIERVVSSPLLRARRTAQAVASRHGLPVEVDPRWIDRDYGAWAGRRGEELVERFGSIDAAPGVEAWSSVQTRLTRALEALLVSRNEVVAVVSHDVVNRALLAMLVTDLPGGAEALEQSTGCWNRLDHLDGTWRATVLNAPPTRPVEA
jgi:broad specificity phosphatase PhoE